MMLEVTQSWMARLQQVVVPIAAQQIKGRSSWERMVSVRCVAGQHIADARGRHGREKMRYGQGEAWGGSEHTLESKEANEGGAGGVVNPPPLEEACGQVETLPSCQDGLCAT